MRYLQEDQNIDGGFGGSPGTQSSPGFTAWVSIALAAAGINPQIQRKPGGGDAYSFLLAHAGQMSYTTDLERELLVVDAAGASPHDFAGVDLVARILERELPEPAAGGIAFPHEAGSKRPGMNDTIFAVLALSPIHELAVQAAVQQASTWIEHEQNANGSWPDVCPKTAPGCSPLGKEPQGESDMTAAALEALNAAGRHGTAAQAQALTFLHTMQDAAEGGFVERPGEAEANVGSTAWAVQGLWAAGVNPEDWKPGGIDPLMYIESMQQPDGHVRWRAKQELNGVWMTAYSGPALFGEPLPITPVSVDLPIAAPAKSGTGGEGAQSGAGVDAGGGGEGAPLFSRPQPGSRGQTAGGARVLASKAHRRAQARGRRRRNPGRPRRGAVPTLAAEMADPAKQTPVGEGASEAGSGTRGAPAKAGTGGGAAKQGHLSTPPAPARLEARGQHEVRGIPIASSASDALEPGAPGLHGAGQRTASSVLAIAIAGFALMLVLGGATVERSRPQVVP